jgi:hypothetical protein
MRKTIKSVQEEREGIVNGKYTRANWTVSTRW